MSLLNQPTLQNAPLQRAESLLQQKYARFGGRRYARQVGSEVMSAPPTITLGGGLATNNYDSTVCRYNNPASTGISGNTATLNPDPNKANPSGNGPIKVRMLSGVPQIATHGYQATISNALSESAALVGRNAYEIGHTGTRIAFGLTPYGGGSYGGGVRVKINGQYTSTSPILLPGTNGIWIAMNFETVATRIITIETTVAPLYGIDIDRYDAVFLPPREDSPFVYVVGDSFGAGANATDGGSWSGMASQLTRALGGEHNVLDTIGGTGLLKVNGSSPNYLTRITATLPILAAAGMVPDLAIIIGSVNDVSLSASAVQAQASAIYAKFGAYGIPVYHVVMPGSGGQAGMASTLAAYQAAASGVWNVLGVLDLTASLTGTGFGQAPPPVWETTTGPVVLNTATGPTAGQYGYVYTSVYSSGESTASAEQVVTVGSGQAPTLYVRTVSGCTYNVYRRPMDGAGNPTGAYVRIGAGVNQIFTDSGSAGTANTPPASNTTGSVQTGTNTTLRSWDGTHPTQAGHDFYFNRILNGLQAVIPGLK